MSGARDKRKKLTAKGHKGSFWCDGNFLYLHCHGKHRDVYACQNFHTVSSAWVHLTVYKLHTLLTLIKIHIKQKTTEFDKTCRISVQ